MNGELLEPGQMDRDQVEYVASDVNYWIGLPYKPRDPPASPSTTTEWTSRGGTTSG